jgi:hypothetical protein
MPGYVQRALQRFAHPKPTSAQHSPHEWTAPIYGARQQFAARNNTPALDLADVKRVQEVLGTLLYYAPAVDGLYYAGRHRQHHHATSDRDQNDPLRCQFPRDSAPHVPLTDHAPTINISILA